jgi:hypothetical protein
VEEAILFSHAGRVRVAVGNVAVVAPLSGSGERVRVGVALGRNTLLVDQGRVKFGHSLAKIRSEAECGLREASNCARAIHVDWI